MILLMCCLIWSRMLLLPNSILCNLIKYFCNSFVDFHARFSNSPEKGVGLVYFTGPTMGYLIGFLTACYLASKIKIDDNFFVVLFKLIIATSTIYILGLIWLGTLIGWDKPIFALGAKPFLLAEIFKIMLLALLTKQIIKIKKFI